MQLYDKYKRWQLSDKYNFIPSLEGHDYVYKINNRKVLADGIRR